MTDYSKRVKIPPYSSFNHGLSPAHQQTMLEIFGRPGAFSEKCSIVTNQKLQSLIQTRNVGPFRVTGLAKLLDDLEQIFSQVRSEKSDVYSQVRSDGMICCRAVRGSTKNFSNHSWGSAIDIRFGEESEEMGDGTMHLGTGELAPYYNARGWYWGAGFGETNPSREDSMHFEASDQLIRKLYGGGNVALTDVSVDQAATPTVPVTILKSKLLKGNEILEAVAEGHLVLRASGERVDGIGPVQEALNQLGYAIDLGGNKQFRGFFGEKTEGALEVFQKAEGLDIDGRVGHETIVALDHALGGGSAAPLAAQPLPQGSLPKRLPSYALDKLSASQGVPWQKAAAAPDFEQYIGVMKDSFAVFGGLTGMPVAEVTSAVIYECKFAIDSDGVADASDTSHQNKTSLRNADGSSLNAKLDRFAVIPMDRKEATKEGLVKRSDLPDFGKLEISIGDLGVAFWGNAVVPFMIGDEGPPNNLGEGSIKMAADLGFDSNPSTGGFNAKDILNMGKGVLHIIFPRSSDVASNSNATGRTREQVLADAQALFAAFCKQTA
jgi:peptidoglycan hydrolase-like protein with peptidoglycan-binding domain